MFCDCDCVMDACLGLRELKKCVNNFSETSDYMAVTLQVRKLNIEGLIAATCTPFDINGNVNLSLIPSYASYLSTQNAKAVFVNGTTGESVLLSLKERKLIIEEWMKVAPKYNLKVIAMVATNNIKDSIDLATRAATNGVDGQLLIYLFIHKYI